jgi:putative spermidine/putrescine transport system ATP-binding protein
MSDIKLTDVTKRYGSLTTVDKLNLDINQGEFIAFLGPSGCGKTTTLRMIAGLTLPDAGSIRFGRRDVTALPPYERNAGIVFQSYALFPHMTIEQNVAFGLEMRKIPRAEIGQRVRNALRLVRMDHFAQRMPKQLSGGQQQRAALARAIVYEPDALLLDEPLSALDAKLRHEVRNELRALTSKLGLTTVFVTHDQDEAISVADRIVVMSNGRIEQIGTPSEIYEMPANMFVAEFIGASNSLEGEDDGAGRFRLKDGQVVGFGHVGATSQRNTISIRPERIRLHRRDAQPVSSDAHRMEAVVKGLVYRGPLTEVIVEAGGQEITAHWQNGLSATPLAIAAGDHVIAEWSPNAAVLL